MPNSPRTKTARENAKIAKRLGRNDVNWLADLHLATGHDPTPREYLTWVKLSADEIRVLTTPVNRLWAEQQGTRFAKPPEVYRAGEGTAQAAIRRRLMELGGLRGVSRNN